MNTTMNTGAASLSDERINELALLNLGYDRAIRPVDFARAIEREVLAHAAIAAGGAQEAVGHADVCPGSAGGFTMAVFKASDVPEGSPLYAAPIPRVAATVALTEERAVEIAAQCWCQMEASGIAMDPRLGEAFARALLATASNGEQS